MTKKRMSDVIGNIDQEIVAEAANYQKISAPKRTRFIKWVAVAAAGVILISAVTVMLLKTQTKNIVYIGGIERNYKKGITSVVHEAAFIWPWKYQKIYNQYNNIKYGGKNYRVCSGNDIDVSHIGESLGVVNAVGYDETDNDKAYTRQFEIFRIKSIKPDTLIAVCMENKYYVCRDDEYNPPQTLGELINSFNLTENLELKYFQNYTNYKGDKNSNYYSTDDNNIIWEQLLKCADTPRLEDDVDLWLIGEREFTSFTITSDLLGTYAMATYVTNDGYFVTNLLGWEHIYHIGEDAAKKIIYCANKNAVPSVREPYNYSVVGTVTEIGENYILVDDSIFCKNAADGIAFKVMADDITIWRYIDSGRVKVGDIVSVDFYKEIDKDSAYVITDAYHINTSVNISDDNEVIIFE